MQIHVKDLKDHIGEEATIRGFVHAYRDQNKIIFILVRDVTGIVQTVAFFKNEESFAVAKGLSMESVVEITGEVKAEEQAPGGFELKVSDIKVLSKADPVLPIPVVTEKGGGDVNQQARLDYRWIDLRQPEKTQIFKVWTSLERGFRNFYYDNDYIQFYSPSFMGTPSETGADVFEVQYFETKAFLAQSPQFYKQMAIASGFEKVFTFNPIFRAELSFTTRHLTEFTGWDFEFAYVKDHHDVMDEEEKMIVSGFEQVKKDFPELGLEVPTTPFPRMKIVDVKEKLAKAGIESAEEHDLSPEEEREISKLIKEENGHDFVFVTDYHISKRPFYHMRYEEDKERTKSADLLYKGLEITTLAQREHRIDILKAQANEKGMGGEELKDYFNFFTYGCPPHGGGGIGAGRIIMRMLELPNIREATFLPRDVKRLNP
jgi:nondiscriminating aspartyl-tRNA synthetase